jgi:iron complex outermembrane receptor protein
LLNADRWFSDQNEWFATIAAKELTKEIRKMKRIGMVLLMASVFSIMGAPCYAAPEAEPQEQEQQQEQVQQLDDVVVKEKYGAPGIEQAPAKTVVDMQTVPTIAVPNSIVDVLKRHAIIDFRGESDIDPGVDSVYMRGFDAKRFVTTLDGVTVQKTGGRKSSNIVDYALLPAFLIDSVEILPGPHTALYDSKSIGGVLNLKIEKPKRRDSLKPDGQLTASYGSYDTQTQEVKVQGAVQAFTYDLAYKHSSSDGYLRHNATDMDTAFGRLGLLLPSDGFITLSASYSDVDRQAPVLNPGQTLTDPPGVFSDYDPDYPTVTGSPWSPLQNPTWDGISSTYRLNAEQATPIGRLSLGAYASRDNRTRAYEEWIDRNDHSQGTYHTEMDTDWWQEGGKVQDEIKWALNHTTTIGFDLARLYDNGSQDRSKTKRVNKKGGYLQHQWGILPSVDTKLGLRYEDVNIRVSNMRSGVEHIPGRGEWIERDWDQLIPKSFTTWKMDVLAPWLRDTSLSLGVSKIWRAPDYHGDYNPQGRPAGAWLEPEHGIGYDLVFDRRLFRDITFKFNGSFYDIKDYIASNRTYARNSGSGAGSQRYSDYKINLEEVYRYGIDVTLGGHLTDDLSFYLTYAWQKFENQGTEEAGETELDKRAEHRVTAGLSYALFENTTLMLDYYFQSDEITENAEEVPPDSDNWVFTEEENPEHHVFDFGVQQLLFKSDRFLREASLKAYVKNIFDEEYKNASGYPATDRTFGISLSFKI